MRFWSRFRRPSEATGPESRRQDSCGRPRSRPRSRRIRRLQVTVAGRWYLALTIGLGVVALVSTNNILYLIESLLLGGLILSGILSERSISAVRIDIRRFPATAGSPSRDQVVVHNLRKFPLFCIEVGEWQDRKLVPLAFLPKLEGGATRAVSARRVFDRRGIHRWDGLAIATSFPFGFARKIKVVDLPGSRIVWPERASGGARRDEGLERRQGIRAGCDVADGEIRPFDQDDDARMIVWLYSAKGTGQYVRPRRSDAGDTEVILDLRQDPGESFEKAVVGAAQVFHRQAGSSGECALSLIDWKGRRKLRGRTMALNELALAEARGRSR